MMPTQLRNVGRPVGDSALRRLRSATWYHSVRSRENLNDCRLDIEFGTAEDEEKRSSADRIKIFEAIRTNGSIPIAGIKGRRTFDLVQRIENHRSGLYIGTAAIIHSPFWRLMENHRLDLKQIRQMVVECIHLLGLHKEEGAYKDDGRDDLQDLVSSDADATISEYFRYQGDVDLGYDNAMTTAFIHLRPSLDYIALIGALALEAIEAGNLIIASNNFDIFKILLKDYCAQPWLNKMQGELYEFGVNRLKNALNADPLKGLPDYTSLLKDIPDSNPGSPAAAFINRHQRLLWRK